MLRFGIGTYAIKGLDPIKYAQSVERLGFDIVAITDSVSGEFEALSTLSAIAVKTKNVGLCTCVVDANRRSPAVLAHATATLDRLSRGRLFLGIGCGGLWNSATYGFSLDKPVSRMRECIEVVKKFWTEDNVSYSGKFFNFDHTKLNAKPIQRPHPPIWIAAFGSRMYKIATELGDGFITQNIPPEVYKKELSRVRSYAERIGKNPDKINAVFAPIPASIAGNHETALSLIERDARRRLYSHVKHLTEYTGSKKAWTSEEDIPMEAIEDCFIFGTPDDCIVKIEKYKRAGVNTIIFLSLLPHGLSSLKLFSEKVLPHFLEDR